MTDMREHNFSKHEHALGNSMQANKEGSHLACKRRQSDGRNNMLASTNNKQLGMQGKAIKARQDILARKRKQSDERHGEIIS